MRPEGAFVPAARAAQHCPELLRRAPDPDELLPQFARLGDRFARLFAAAVAPLAGGVAPDPSVTAQRQQSEAELSAEIGPLAANCLISTGVPGLGLVASVEAGAVLGLVDRAFGGKGESPATLPERFAPSAGLMIERLHQLAAQCLGEAMGSKDPAAVRVLRRESAYAELAPFPAAARLATLSCRFAQGGQPAWTLRLALPLASLPRLLGDGGPAVAPASGSADPAAAPFADVPLGLHAVLVDMRVPLSALSALEPGVLLPVAVDRAAALRLGSTTIARGSPGLQDDRIALRITHLA